jgi:GGDEF domain-containing protein
MSGWQMIIVAAAVLLMVVLVGVLVVSNRQATRQLRFVERRLAHQVVHDEVTGLLNPAGATLLGEQILSLAKRDSDPATSCLVRVSPRSAATGEIHQDDLLAVSEAATEVFRTSDMISRISADTLLMVGKGTQLNSDDVERRLIEQMARMVPEGDPVPQILVGCAMIAPWESASLETLIDRAQQNLQSRVAGR